ncbi:GNAT family N-acetyltransferase [Planococcus sp. 1R117A]
MHAAGHTIIGDMGFRCSTESKGELELGYGIVPSYQVHGYATEMAKAIVR